MHLLMECLRREIASGDGLSLQLICNKPCLCIDTHFLLQEVHALTTFLFKVFKSELLRYFPTRMSKDQLS
jgi:hypothetical protein